MSRSSSKSWPASETIKGQFLQTQKHKTIFIQLYKPGKRPAGPVFLVDAEKVKKNSDLMENSTILNPEKKTSRTPVSYTHLRAHET